MPNTAKQENMKTSEDLLHELLETEGFNSKVELIEEFRRLWITEAISVCESHSESGCFDREGAEANIL